jgi:hypothetical protein
MADDHAATGATSPSGDPHPGDVEFDDQIEGRTWRQRPEELPQSIAWVEVEPGRWAAVTRVVTAGAPSHLEITRFGSGGVFLDVTVQRPSR